VVTPPRKEKLILLFLIFPVPVLLLEKGQIGPVGLIPQSNRHWFYLLKIFTSPK